MRGLLMLVIFIGNIVAIPLVNTIHPTILSMPFFLFWLLLWMIVTPLLTWWIYAIDKTRKAKSEH